MLMVTTIATTTLTVTKAQTKANKTHPEHQLELTGFPENDLETKIRCRRLARNSPISAVRKVPKRIKKDSERLVLRSKVRKRFMLTYYTHNENT